MNEIEQLRTDNEALQQRNNELGERLIYLEKQNADIKNTIRTAMENERTHIGYNVLKQLLEQLE